MAIWKIIHTYKYIANLDYSIQKYIHITLELIFLAKHYCYNYMGSPRNFLSLLCVFCNFVDYLEEKNNETKFETIQWINKVFVCLRMDLKFI